MAFKLVEVERGNNINDYIYRIKAVSEDKEKLKTYCKKTFKRKAIDEPDELEDFPWGGFYMIVEREDLIIL